MSDETPKLIDKEVKSIIDTCYKMMHEADPTQYPRIF